MNKRYYNQLTTEQFVEKAKQKHGDMYDYSKVVYINNKTKVEIICSIHGSFLKSPKKHFIGQGCLKCSNIVKANKFKSTKDKCIEKALIIHAYK